MIYKYSAGSLKWGTSEACLNITNFNICKLFIISKSLYLYATFHFIELGHFISYIVNTFAIVSSKWHDRDCRHNQWEAHSRFVLFLKSRANSDAINHSELWTTIPCFLKWNLGDILPRPILAYSVLAQERHRTATREFWPKIIAQEQNRSCSALSRPLRN